MSNDSSSNFSGLILHPHSGIRLLVYKEVDGLVHFQVSSDLFLSVDLDSLRSTPGAIIKGTSWYCLHRAAFSKFVLDGFDKIGINEIIELDQIRSVIEKRSSEIPPIDWSAVRINENDCSYSLRPYQQIGCAWASSAGLNALLGDEMGLGKTIQMGAALEAARPVRRRALIVTTKSTLYNWFFELSRWAKSWTPFVVNSVSDFNKIPVDADVLILTWGMIHRVLDRVFQWEPDTLFADEAHYLASGYQTQRGRAFIALSSRCKSTMLMTGTPLVNCPSDIWPILHILDPVNFSTFGKFGNRFCNPTEVFIKGGRTIVKYDGASDREGLAQILSMFQLRRVKSDVLLDLPERIEKDVFVSVPTSVRQNWKDALRLIRQSNTLDGSVLSGITRAWHESGQAKVDAVLEYVHQLISSGEGPVIVLVYHSDVCDSLISGFLSCNLRVCSIVGETNAKQRASIVREFQDSRYDVMVGSTALREGVTLTRARHVVQAEYWWTEAAMDQGSSRAHRYGQSRDVVVHYIHARGTIDDHIKNVVRGKKEFRENIVEQAAMIEFARNLAKESN